MKVKKAVIPAAGFGTRFLLATKVVPKELLPIVDKPTIQYIMEEVAAAGIEEVILIIGRENAPLRTISTLRQNWRTISKRRVRKICSEWFERSLRW